MRNLWAFAAIAVICGGALLGLSTVLKPEGPFLLATVYLALAVPALVLAHREGGRRAVRDLLRDCVRVPRQWWWLLVAGLALPTATWLIGAPLGGAHEVSVATVTAYLLDLGVGLLLVNLWEELGWTGYFQRRAVGRWGLTMGSLVTAAFFTAIHLPLALTGVQSLGQAAHNVAQLAGLAIGFRLVIAHLDGWTGSLLVIGLFHSSFNASEAVLEPSYDVVRSAVVAVVGIGLVAIRSRGTLQVATTQGGNSGAACSMTAIPPSPSSHSRSRKGSPPC